MRPAENHPDYFKWRKASEGLVAAKYARGQGKASQAEVDKAQAEYDRISQEIDGDD